MPDPIMAALTGERITLSNSLATVATTCVVVRTVGGRSNSIISLSRITGIQTLRTSVPGLLVIASGLFLVAAAAHYSKDGGQADLPIALLGLAFVIGYLGSRRAAIVFLVDGETIETVSGGLREAAALARAVRLAIKELEEDSSETSAVAS